MPRDRFKYRRKVCVCDVSSMITSCRGCALIFLHVRARYYVVKQEIIPRSHRIRKSLVAARCITKRLHSRAGRAKRRERESHRLRRGRMRANPQNYAERLFHLAGEYQLTSHLRFREARVTRALQRITRAHPLRLAILLPVVCVLSLRSSGQRTI